MKVLSIINLKGGVAKTISSVNMAHILATVHGFKVLLIDNDKQGNASKIMNRHDYQHKGTAEVMTQRGINPAEVIQHTDYDGLDIITANMNLLTANLEVMLDQSRPQQTRFKKFLEGLQSEYDYCIIDTPPALGILTINALTACRGAIIPAQADIYSLQGISQLNRTVETVRRYCNRDLYIMGIVLTRYSSRSIISREVAEMLEETAEQLHTKLYKAKIRECTAIKEAQATKHNIFSYAPKSNATADYKALVDEILGEGTK